VVCGGLNFSSFISTLSLRDQGLDAEALGGVSSFNQVKYDQNRCISVYYRFYPRESFSIGQHINEGVLVSQAISKESKAPDISHPDLRSTTDQTSQLDKICYKSTDPAMVSANNNSTFATPDTKGIQQVASQTLE
jgi:hypothetical protein